jgi:DNA-binding NarL/FixJ family response regulator
MSDTAEKVDEIGQPFLRVFILGAKNLYTELLVFALQKQVSQSCEVIAGIPALAESLSSEPPDQDGQGRKRLLLIDCVENDFDQTIREITASQLTDKTIIAIYNVYPGWGIEEEALHLGVRGFFYKHDSLKLLVKGINAVASGEVWISREILLRSAMGVRPNRQLAIQEKTGLSAREIEILFLVGGGAQNDEIADKLFISPHTVKTHLYHIFKKINVPNRLQAALWVAKNLARREA